MNAIVDPGSFRDPGGHVFEFDRRVLRTIMTPNVPAYEAARAIGLYDKLADQDLLLPAIEVGDEAIDDAGRNPAYVLEHPRLEFVSYPYEWSFALHRAAALLHLDMHLAALDEGFTLSDASAYNVQFIGCRPVFIDHLSLRPYRDREIWAGHRQFCMQFLNPLLFWTLVGTPPNAWFRGSLEGIAPEDLSRLLPLRKKLSPTVFMHVALQGALQRKAVGKGAGGDAAKVSGMPRESFRGMLTGLRSYIEKMRRPGEKTVWADYANSNSYNDEEAAAKRAFVAKMVETVKPRLLFDIGCNTGDYSDVAMGAGARNVVGFDFDHGALDIAYDRFRESGKPFVPLWLDAANPSPSQGWAQSERRGLSERSNADALIALAFIHHIAIGRNVPLPMALDWLLGLAPTGVIEFPSKHDPMVQRLLATREDIFPDYDETAFLAHLGKRARIVESTRVSANGRLLVWYDRRP